MTTAPPPRLLPSLGTATQCPDANSICSLRASDRYNSSWTNLPDVIDFWKQFYTLCDPHMYYIIIVYNLIYNIYIYIFRSLNAYYSDTFYLQDLLQDRWAKHVTPLLPMTHCKASAFQELHLCSRLLKNRDLLNSERNHEKTNCFPGPKSLLFWEMADFNYQML